MVNGLAIDTARDLTDINKSPKILSNFLYNQPSYSKKTIAFSFAAFSALATYSYLKVLGM